MSTIAEKLKTTYLGIAGLTTSMRQLLSVGAKEVTSQEINNKLNDMAKESTSQEILDKVSGMGAVANELQSGKQAIVDAINHMGGEATEGNTLTDLANKINGLSLYEYEGVEFADDVEVPHPLSIGFVIANRNKVKKIIDHTTKTSSYYGSTTTGGIVRGNDYLEYVEYSALEDAGPGGSFSSCPKLEIVLVPKLKTIGTNSCQTCGKLNIVDVSSLTSWSGLIFQKSNNVIDLIIGGGFESNVNTGEYYNPTGAYSKTSSSLCFDTDMDRYGQTFANNWEKWKWCIINHWAANLQDRTNMNAYTITFGVAAVLEQFDEEMIAAFTNKNWNLA